MKTSILVMLVSIAAAASLVVYAPDCFTQGAGGGGPGGGGGGGPGGGGGGGAGGGGGVGGGGGGGVPAPGSTLTTTSDFIGAVEASHEGLGATEYRSGLSLEGEEEEEALLVTDEGQQGKAPGEAKKSKKSLKDKKKRVGK